MTIHPKDSPDRIRSFIGHMQSGYEVLSKDPRFKGNNTGPRFVKKIFKSYSDQVVEFTACASTCADVGLYQRPIESVLKNSDKLPEIIKSISGIYIPIKIIMDNLPDDYSSSGQIIGATNATFEKHPEVISEFFEPNSYLMVQYHSDNYWYTTMDRLVYYINDRLRFDINQISNILNGIANDIENYKKMDSMIDTDQFGNTIS